MKYVSKVLWVVVIVAVVLIVKQEFIDKNQATDVTDLRNASTTQVESALNVKLSSAPGMASSIYEYSETGGVTVKGDVGNGIGVVYLNGFQSGLRVEDPQYKLFNIAIGKSRVGMRNAMTYQYEDEFEIGEEVEKELWGDRKDFPVFFCNWTNNDCVVVTCDKKTGIVIAVTYFNNAKKVTERLVFRGKK